jgi:hypothetical protein
MTEGAESYENGLEQAAREAVRGGIQAAAGKVLATLLPEIRARLAEVGDGTSCEAHAARAREAGRLQVVAVDMWDALGLPRPNLDEQATSGGRAAARAGG